MTLPSSVSTYNKLKSIEREKERIMKAFADNPTTEHRAITKVTRRILLNAPYFLRGKFWDVKAKSLGAGIYKLSLIKKEGNR